jgi:alpha-tubulin suppressor-like RCC1 family protein
VTYRPSSRILAAGVAAIASLTLAVSMWLSAPTAGAVSAGGALWNWGANMYGQLGDGTFKAHRTPRPVPDLPQVIAVAGGREHVLALTPRGDVIAWGWNRHGQVGNGSTAATVRTPTTVLSDVTDIGAGHYSSFAVAADGTVWSWGRNDTGQLGDGTMTNRFSPHTVSGLAGHTIIDVAGGRNHAMALADDGTVFTWGNNRFGQLGNGTFRGRLTAAQVPGLADVVQVFAGRDHCLAVSGDGTVWAWGHNKYGELGDGTLTNRSSPRRVTRIAHGSVVRLSNVIDVDAGAYHSMARTSRGRLWTWGWNADGQLGDGTYKSRSRAVRVKALTGVGDIAGGREASIAVVTDGTVYTWGDNLFGQLGDGTRSDTGRKLPGVVPGVADAGAVGMGRDYAMAVVAAQLPGGRGLT